MVDRDYEGGGYGWPADVASLRAFYAWQAESRPDWKIDVEQTVELGDCVVVRARGHGTVVESEGIASSKTHKSVEWMTAYRVRNGRIINIEVLALAGRDPS